MSGQGKPPQPRKGRAQEKETINTTLNQVLLAISEPPDMGQRLTERINRLKALDEISTMTAKDFSLESAVFAFDLRLPDRGRRTGLLKSVRWPIQDFAETQILYPHNVYVSISSTAVDYSI
jgi:hypothetical protein